MEFVNFCGNETRVLNLRHSVNIRRWLLLRYSFFFFFRGWWGKRISQSLLNWTTPAISHLLIYLTVMYYQF